MIVLPEPQRTAEVSRLLERNPRIAALVQQYRRSSISVWR